MRGTPFAVLIAAVLTPAAAGGATTVTYESGRGEERAHHVFRFDARHLRADMRVGDPRGSVTVILDPGARKMFTLMPATKQYLVWTPADLARIERERQERITHQTEGVAGLPPDLRPQAQRRLDDLIAGWTRPEHQPLQTRRKVNGIDCEMFRVKRGSMAAGEMCVAVAASGPLSAEDLATWKGLQRLLSKTFGAFVFAMPVGMLEAPGLRVEWTASPGIDDHRGPGGTLRTVLTTVSHDPLPASTFVVPADFALKTRD